MVSYKQRQSVPKTDTYGNTAVDLKQTAVPTSNQAALSAVEMDENAGIDRSLSDDMRTRLEQHFGYGLSSLRVRESQEAQKLGGKALAKGNIIHLQPGILQDSSLESEKIVAHEVAHAVAQATEPRYRTAGESQVVVDAASERMADRSAEGFLSSSINSEAQTETLQSLPAAPASAPVEGWGISILGRKGKGAHEKITEAARQKAFQAHRHLSELDDGTPLESDKAGKSLRYGTRFNDVGSHSAVGMALQMEVLKKSPFINQTHKGDMQFLHSMDSSNGDTAANVAKMRRYARFASDVYQNRVMPGQPGQPLPQGQVGPARPTRMQDMNMLDYVLSQEPEGEEGTEYDPFQEMMLSSMVNPSALKKFDRDFDSRFAAEEKGRIVAGQQPRTPAERRQARTARLRDLLTFSDDEEAAAREAATLKYANKSWFGKKFADYTKGFERGYIDKEVKKARQAKMDNRSKYAKRTVGEFFTNGNKKLDAGMVALGSASHMLEDSFAGSHAIRSDNLYLGTTRDTELSTTGMEIANKATPIMGNADYSQQDSTPKFGRHGKADKILKGRKITGESELSTDLRATQGGSLARDTAAQYMLMNVRMKEQAEQHASEQTAQDTPEQIQQRLNAEEESKQALDAFVTQVTRSDANTAQHGITPTGRAYDKKFKGAHEDKPAREGIAEYRELTEALVGNKHTTPTERIKQFPAQLAALRKIFGSGSPEAKARYLPHAREMEANIRSMIAQIAAANPQPASAAMWLDTLNVQLSEIVQVIARANQPG